MRSVRVLVRYAILPALANCRIVGASGLIRYRRGAGDKPGETEMAGRLKGKVAVVTGAAPRGEGVGNGMATAILFAREGARVVLVNRSAERAEQLKKRIKDEGGEAVVFAGDVVNPEVTEAMAAFAVKTFGRLDILHNNVGIGGVPGTPETVQLEG